MKVGILFGGRSAEHEVSVVSAQGVMAAIDTDRFQPVPIGVTRQGTWLTPAQTEQALARIRSERLSSLDEPLGDGILYRTQALTALRRVDIVFPLIHGTNGEDGTLQGLLELVGVPYVGAGVAASAIGMDKALQKTIFRQLGIPVADDVVVSKSMWRSDPRACVHGHRGHDRVPVLRQARQRRLQHRHVEGALARGPRAGARRGVPLRPQGARREGDRRAAGGDGGARQR